MEAYMAVVGGLRSTREELGLSRDVIGRVRVIEGTPGAAGAMKESRNAFRQLCGCELTEVTGGEAPLEGRFATVTGPGVKALLDLEGLVDVERERMRLVSKARKAQAEVLKARAKLANEGFVAKAPEAVVAEERSRLDAAEAVLAEVQLQHRERVGGELDLSEGTH
jgi:valyl-tRNA synthetase